MGSPMTTLQFGLATALVAVCRGFTASIASSREKCFTLVATEAQKLYGSYSVHFGGAMDINVMVTDPEKKTIYREEATQSGSFEFVAQQSGIYRFCLNNQKTSVSTKRLSFSYHASNEIKTAGVHISKHFGSLEAAVSNVAVGLHSIQDHHHYMQVRYKFSQQTNEQTLSRVNTLCFFEIAAIVLLCGFQIMFIHKMFAKK